jgi:hypothetical protein
MLTPAEEAELAALEAQYGEVAPTSGLSTKAQKFLGGKEASHTQEFLGGLKHSLDRAAYGVKSLLPQSVQRFGDELDRKLGLGGLGQEQYEQGKAFVQESSPVANFGDVTGDVLLGLAPGSAAMRGGSVLKQALGRRALPGTKIAAEAAGNAAWNAATSPEDREVAALLGAGGAVAGSAVNRLISGPLANQVTPEARRLMDKGIALTPGQMVSGGTAGMLPRTFRNLEDTATSIPLLGDVIKHRSIGAIEDWNLREINNALKPAGVKVKNVGVTGFDDARSALRTKYDEVVEHVTVDPAEAKVFLDDMAEGLKHHNLLNDNQRKYVEKWVNLHLGRHIKEGEPIVGPTARTIDRGFEEEVAKWRTKGSAWDQSLVDAFEELHKGWRGTLLKGTSDNPKAGEELAKLVEAQNNLDFLQKAANKSTSGVFSPMQLQRVNERANRPFSRTLKDAKLVLPQTVPSTGSAERAILYHMATPGGVSATAAGAGAMGGLAPLAATAAGLAGMYTKPGAHYMASGILPKKLTDKFSREEVEHVIKLLSQQGSRATLNDYE